MYVSVFLPQAGRGVCATSFVFLPHLSARSVAMAASSSGEKGGGSNRKRRQGKGSQERKAQKREERYEAQHLEPEPVFDLAGKYPATLSPLKLNDCKFAVGFAQGVEREHAALRKEQQRYGRLDDEADALPELTSSYGFFNKSTILVETMCPQREGTPHISTLFGVPGCGKTVHLENLLASVFSGEHHIIAGKTPSVYVGSISNVQCKNVFKIILDLHQRDDSVPMPTWICSKEFMGKAEVSRDEFTLEHARTAIEYPRPGSVFVATHRLAAKKFSNFHFHVVVLDETGGVELYLGALLNGMARRMAVLMGDVLQGSKPCLTVADRHCNISVAESFKSHSYRCPAEIMDVVQPAYAAACGFDLVLTGEVRENAWSVSTTYNEDLVESLKGTYGSNMLTLGFTLEAIKPFAHALTVDAAQGLEVALTVLIIELKQSPQSHQYDVKRVVPALTRHKYGLILMWKQNSKSSIPWAKLEEQNPYKSNGILTMYNFMCSFSYERPANIVNWYQLEDVRSDLCGSQPLGALVLYEGYQSLANEIYEKEQPLLELADVDAGDMLALMDGDGNDKAALLDVETEEPTNDTEPFVQESVRRKHLHEPRFTTPAKLLADFAGTAISYIVVETRGKVHVGTPSDKLLKKYVFQDCQHGEKGDDCGNYVYGVVYELLCEFMKDQDVAIPLGASQAKSSPAGNIIESYKMLAEQVKNHDGVWNANELLCIHAYSAHLRGMVPSNTAQHETPVYACFETCYGFTCVCFWVPNLTNAQRLASALLEAFDKVHASVLQEHFMDDDTSDGKSDGTLSQRAPPAAGRRDQQETMFSVRSEWMWRYGSLCAHIDWYMQKFDMDLRPVTRNAWVEFENEWGGLRCSRRERTIFVQARRDDWTRGDVFIDVARSGVDAQCDRYSCQDETGIAFIVQAYLLTQRATIDVLRVL